MPVPRENNNKIARCKTTLPFNAKVRWLLKYRSLSLTKSSYVQKCRSLPPRGLGFARCGVEHRPERWIKSTQTIDSADSVSTNKHVVTYRKKGNKPGDKKWWLPDTESIRDEKLLRLFCKGERSFTFHGSTYWVCSVSASDFKFTSTASS